MFDVYAGCIMNEQHSKNKNYRHIRDQCDAALKRFMVVLDHAIGWDAPTDEPIRAALDSLKQGKEKMRVGLIEDYVAEAAMGSGEEEDASAMLAQLYKGYSGGVEDASIDPCDWIGICN